jgi:hypothetical protein
MSLHTEATVFATSIRDVLCGDAVKNLTSGAGFTAIIETNPDPLAIPEALGDDPRPKVLLHVTSFLNARKINKNDLVQFNQYGSPVTFQIVAGFADNSGPQSIFIGAQIIAKDQH